MAKQWQSPPDMQIDPQKQYTATMETNKGTIELELFAEHAPITVNNFVFLSREGYYDGVTFHRVISNFVIQGGDPTGTGGGGPGYTFQDEFAGNPHKHGTGQSWSRHQRLAILHHPCPTTPFRRHAHCFWQSIQRHGCRQQHSPGRQNDWRHHH
jgi:hypothetical protein